MQFVLVIAINPVYYGFLNLSFRTVHSKLAQLYLSQDADASGTDSAAKTAGNLAKNIAPRDF